MKAIGKVFILFFLINVNAHASHNIFMPTTISSFGDVKFVDTKGILSEPYAKTFNMPLLIYMPNDHIDKPEVIMLSCSLFPYKFFKRQVERSVVVEKSVDLGMRRLFYFNRYLNSKVKSIPKRVLFCNVAQEKIAEYSGMLYFGKYAFHVGMYKKEKMMSLLDKEGYLTFIYFR